MGRPPADASTPPDEPPSASASPAGPGQPALDPDPGPAAGSAGAPPETAAPEPEAPGLFEQVGSTRDSVKRLVDAHVELARAEFEDIADSVKRAVAFGGVAIGAVVVAGLLLGLGIPLWLGEWIFGSIGWGILLGVLFLSAVALVAVVLALRPAVDGRIGQSFLGGVLVGVVVGLIFGLDLTNRGWTWLGDQVGGTFAADSRPLLVAVIVLGAIGALLGLIGGLARGLGGGAIGALVVGAIGGIALGFLTAAAPGPRVGAAIGVAAGLIAWMAFMGMSVARGGFDTDRLKEQYWPERTIRITKETIEWARERMPLMRRS